jgi:hypothetical protein
MSTPAKKRKPYFHKYYWANKKKSGESPVKKASTKKGVSFQILRNDAFGVEKCKNENASNFFQSLESSEYGIIKYREISHPR